MWDQHLCLFFNLFCRMGLDGLLLCWASKVLVCQAGRVSSSLPDTSTSQDASNFGDSFWFLDPSIQVTLSTDDTTLLPVTPFPSSYI